MTEWIGLLRLGKQGRQGGLGCKVGYLICFVVVHGRLGGLGCLSR